MVTIHIRKNRLKKNGEAPLYLRITKNRVARYISLRLSLDPIHWDERKKQVRRGHPNSKRLNQLLLRKKADAMDIIIELELANKHLTTDAIKEKILGKRSTDFIEYFEQYVKRMEKEDKIPTSKKAAAILSKISKYNGGQTLFFENITVTWLKNFESYLKTELKNRQNTVHSALKMIRKLFNDAIKEELIPKEIYPFDKYQLVWEKNKKTDHLTEEQVQAIKELKLKPGSRDDLCRDMFVFSCFAGGIRVSDLLNLKVKNCDGTNINFKCLKTGEQMSIRLPKIAREIVIKHSSAKAQEELLFPLLQSTNSTSAVARYKARSSATSVLNNHLKIIAKRASIAQPITSHWARRTFSCLALNKGMNLDIVSKILGHTGQTITLESYVRYSQEHLHKSMDDIFE